MCVILLSALLANTAHSETYVAETRPQNIKVYAFSKVLDRWGEKQWSYFSDLVNRESGWDSEAKNPKSSACGLGQTMMSLYGKDLPKDFCTDPYEQIDWTIEYINTRYKLPSKAILFHNQKNYY